MAPFLSNSDFLIRYDWRWCAKNLTDGTTLTNNVAATLAELQGTTGGGAVLTILLTEASELVMAAAAVGARYTEADIRSRPLDNPPYMGGGALLARIVADLTMGLILKRRARALTDEDELSKPYAEALAYLEQLRRGERIFWAVPNVPEAGLPESASMEPRVGIDPPTQSMMAGRYFGFPAAYPNGVYPGNPYYPNPNNNPPN